MQRVRPVRMSATETAAVWVRWRRGGSISEIGRAMDRSPGSIFYQLATHGGISPVPRTRSWRALTLHDREEISRGLASGRSLRAISAGLGRAPSTISREVQRHGGRAQYRAAAADVCTWYRARRPKPCRLAPSAALRALVAAKLAADWSPQQIAGWLKQTFPDHPHLQVSHETIYVSLFVQSRGVLKKELFTHLRRRRRMRQARQATTAGQARGRIIDAVSIRERPAEAADRAVPGHWEAGRPAHRRGGAMVQSCATKRRAGERLQPVFDVAAYDIDRLRQPVGEFILSQPFKEDQLDRGAFPRRKLRERLLKAKPFHWAQQRLASSGGRLGYFNGGAFSLCANFAGRGVRVPPNDCPLSNQREDNRSQLVNVRIGAVGFVSNLRKHGGHDILGRLGSLENPGRE